MPAGGFITNRGCVNCLFTLFDEDFFHCRSIRVQNTGLTPAQGFGAAGEGVALDNGVPRHEILLVLPDAHGLFLAEGIHAVLAAGFAPGLRLGVEDKVALAGDEAGDDDGTEHEFAQAPVLLVGDERFGFTTLAAANGASLVIDGLFLGLDLNGSHGNSSLIVKLFRPS